MFAKRCRICKKTSGFIDEIEHHTLAGTEKIRYHEKCFINVMDSPEKYPDYVLITAIKIRIERNRMSRYRGKLMGIIKGAEND